MSGGDVLSPQRIQPPSLFYLEKVSSDMKNTAAAAIADLRSDIQAVAYCITDLEQTSQTHAAAIRQVQSTYDTQLSKPF